MKKILSIGLILVLMLIMFGCKSKPIEEDAEVYVESVGNEGENETEPEPEQQTDPEQHSEPKQDEQQSPEQQEVQQPEQNEEQEPEQNNERQTALEQTEQNKAIEKAPPCEVTIDEDFKVDKLSIMLTREESRKQKTYTAEDFPELDVEKISVLLRYKPEKDSRVGLTIILKTQDKQSLIDAVRILEGYDFVYCVDVHYNDAAILSTTDENASMTIEQMENIISEPSVTPYYTRTDAGLEYDANLSTLACCAKKYTTAGINKTTAIGFVGDWC